MLSNMINCGRFAFSTPADRKGGSLISSLGRGVLVCVVAGRGVVFDACRLNPSLHPPAGRESHYPLTTSPARTVQAI
jgi:hypothetical protein